MILFYIFAGTVLIFVVLAIVSPLIRKIDAERVIRESNDKNNLSVIKKYRNEIDSDYKMGVISKSQFEKSISELEQRYINEMGDDEVGVYSQASNSLRTVIVLVFVLPIFASGLYLMLGNRGAIETERQIADSVSSITLDEFKTMTQKLSMHLKENPGDMTGWVMLGRAHFVLGQFREAVDAWRNPLKSDPGNIELKINMAEALVLLNDGGITAESSRLVQEILNVDPMHRKALAMAGGERFAAGDYIGSIAIWEKLLLIVGNDVGFAESIRKNIKEAKTRHEGKEKGLFVSGMVRL